MLRGVGNCKAIIILFIFLQALEAVRRKRLFGDKNT